MAITQKNRRLKVTSPFGEDDLIPTSLKAWERVSGLFEFECAFVSERENLDFNEIVGQGVGLELEGRGGDARHFHGVVASFSQSDADAGNIEYRAKLVPWLWFLTRSADCRIFQNKSVVDIIKEVFDDHKLSDYKLDKLGSYDPIPYCVQYRETDFNFVSRLMEDWGIGYFFSHSADAHELVLFDANASVEECAAQPKAAYETHAGGENAPGQVLEWHVEQAFRTGAYALTDYNYEDPGLDLGVEKTTQQAVGGNDRFEVYDYPGDYRALKPGDSRAQLRMEAEECAAKRIQGSGTCYGFCPGYKFDLVGHHRGDYNATYLVTEVQHRYHQAVGRSGAASNYQNSFACVPHAVPYRPPQLAPKPIVQGVQTAVVTGAEGKEVDVDPEGRIVVQFHWDRKGEKDEKSSCRVRVAQAWAGKEWGAYFIPRIGQEVMVEFEEGDPDRPIVTGRVYNGEQKPPYTDGEHSGIKTRSTKQGESANFNEIRFQDTKGSELLFTQAEKDRETLIKNDERKKVENDQTLNVAKNKAVTVGLDHTETIDGVQTVHVKKTRTDTVDENEERGVGGDRTRTVTGNETVTIDEKQKIAVNGEREVAIGADDGLAVAGNLAVSVDDNYGVSVTGDHSLEAARVTLEAHDEILLKTGGASIKLDSSGDITIDGAKITIKGSGDLILKGSKIKEN
jgi:type VI secretion system secreted protein VgrG